MSGFNDFLKKIFGTPEGRMIKRLDDPVAKINALSDEFEKLSDQQLREKTFEFKRRLGDGETLDSIMVEAFAAVREAGRRYLGMRPYDVQLKGGMVLHMGDIAEMVTGEGKTLVATLPAYLNALEGKGVHVITVNDYLAQRDRDWMAPVYEGLGLTVGCIQSPMMPHQRQPEYACDITYGTNNEFGFDYLRDNMKSMLDRQVQGPLNYAIIDEVDSILIDDARTPLIISGSSKDEAEKYRRANEVAMALKRSNDGRLKDLARIYGSCAWLKTKIGAEMKNLDLRFNNDWAHSYHEHRDRFATPLLDRIKALEDTKKRSKDQDEELKALDDFMTNLEKMAFANSDERKNTVLTDHGEALVEQELGVGSIYQGTNMEWPHLINNALRAHEHYLRERDYVIKDGEVIIVDENTGRLMEGRRWSDGLHQAVEAKEAMTSGEVKIREEQQTLATITLQNYFRLYAKLAGMTGTAKTEEGEFYKIYKLQVVPIPTNRPLHRVAMNDLIFGTATEKDDAIVTEIERLHRLGRPVLVGTTSVDKSEILSRVLSKRGVKHVVLNAKRHKEEAAIVAQAGRTGAVTIATNMAGRGTDILLGGNPSYFILGDINTMPEERRDRILALLDRYLHSPINKASAQEFDDARTLMLRDKHLGRIPDDLVDVIDDIEKVVKKHEAEAKKNKADVLDPASFAVDKIGMGSGPGQKDSEVPWWHEAYKHGGLHIVGTERHESRRVDNQLRGRCGRQGDPGSSQFFLSLEDDLMRLFAPNMIKTLLQSAGVKHGQPIISKMISRSVQTAQKKVEARNFDIRKNLLEYDEVMDRQRKTLYTLRQGVLEGLTYVDSPRVLDRVLRIPKIEKERLERDSEGFDFERWYEWHQTCLRVQGRLPQVADDDVLLTEFKDRYLTKVAHRFRALRIRKSERDKLVSASVITADTGDGDDDAVKDAPTTEAGAISYETWYENFQREFENPRPLAEGDRWEMLPDSLRREHLRRTAMEKVMGTMMRQLEAFSDDEREASEWELEDICLYFNAEFKAYANAATVAELAGLGPRGILDYLRNKALWEKDEAIARIQKETAKLTKKEQASYVDEFLGRFRITFDEEELETARTVKKEQRVAFFVDKYKEYCEKNRATEIGKGRMETLETAVMDATGGWDLPSLTSWLSETTRTKITSEDFYGKSREEATDWLENKVRELYAEREQEMGKDAFAAVEQFAMLETIDACWKDHLREMDYLRSAVSLVGYAQKDPKIAYKTGGLQNFTEMQTLIDDRFTDKIFKARLADEDALKKLEARQSAAAQARKSEFQAPAAQTKGGETVTARGGDRDNVRKQFDDASNKDMSGQQVETIRREDAKVGRNDPCPCGSGKKYKSCHGAAGAPPLVAAKGKR